MPDSLSSWLALLERRHPKSIDLGLDRCSEVWQAMGSPRPSPRVVTVGGTNGKGSAVAYLAALLSSAGLRVGTYTSPHVLRFNERLQLPGGVATDAALVEAFEHVEEARGNTSLTYFEFSSLAIFHLMKEADLDWAILEVGLGGRLDTVNLVDADATVIMPIGLDHQAYLGHDRETIGFEKAGILRDRVPLICGDRNPPRSLISIASGLEAPVFILGRDFEVDRDAGMFRFGGTTEPIPVPAPPLAGPHQYDNLATAIATASILAPEVLEDRAAWTQALDRVRVTGRLSAHAADARVMLDVGHNPLAAGVVARALDECGAGKVHCVLGMLRDKDVESVAEILSPCVARWYLAGLGGPRGQSGDELSRRLGSILSNTHVDAYPGVAEALRAARGSASETECILVFGSFETVAVALRELDGGTGSAHQIQSGY